MISSFNGLILKNTDQDGESQRRGTTEGGSCACSSWALSWLQGGLDVLGGVPCGRGLGLMMEGDGDEHTASLPLRQQEGCSAWAPRGLSPSL